MLQLRCEQGCLATGVEMERRTGVGRWYTDIIEEIGEVGRCTYTHTQGDVKIRWIWGAGEESRLRRVERRSGGTCTYA